MSTYRRELASPDKAFIAYNELRPPFIIQLVLEAKSDPSGEQLHDALERTTAANPGSSLALDQESDPPDWKIGPPPSLTIIDAPDFNGDRDGAEFLLWHLDASAGPTCELVYVRGSEQNYLVFRALHAVMDGHGTLLWAQDFMRALRGEEPLGHPSTLTFDQLIRRLSPPRREPPKEAALHPFGLPLPESAGAYHWRRVKVDRPLDAAMSGRIAVALAESARRSGAEGPVRINLPTNLRHYCAEERATGNLFGALFLDVPPGASADMIGLRVVQMLYRNEGTKPVGLYAGDETASLAAHRVKVLWDLAHVHDTGRYGVSATLSHLGVLKPAELSAPLFATTSAFFVPLISDSGCVITLNGFGDHTEACAGISDRFRGIDALEALIRGAIEGTD